MFSPYIKMSMFNGISVRIAFCDNVSPLFVLYKCIKYARSCRSGILSGCVNPPTPMHFVYLINYLV